MGFAHVVAAGQPRVDGPEERGRGPRRSRRAGAELPRRLAKGEREAEARRLAVRRGARVGPREQR